jgi:hypothetical protein
MASCQPSANHPTKAAIKLTYPSDDNDMPILPRPHDREDSFDDIHISKEVDLEDLIDKTDSPVTLRQLLDGPDDR